MQRDAGSELRPLQRLAWPGFVLDLGAGELLTADSRLTELRAQALKVLLVLGERAGQVVGKDELIRRVWGDVIVTEDSLVQAVGDIRRVLGDAKHERVRTVPRRGYLLVLDAPTPPVPPPAPAAVANRRRAWPLALAVVVALVALAAGLYLWPQPDAPSRTLAILPFDKDAATEDWFVDGVTNELTTIVASWRDLQVIGRGTMSTYKGRAVDAREIGRELGVRHVLAGHARRAGDRVSLAVELVDTRDGRIVWADQRELPRGELDRAVGEVAGGIARALMGGYGDAIVVDALKLAPSQAQADDLALKGMAELLRSVSREHWEGARMIFERGLEIDPDCRRCLAGVSLTNTNLALWEWADDRAAAIARAEQTLARLDQLEPDMLPAQLAHASLTNLRHDWAGLLAVGDRLVQTFPYEPAAHNHRCSALLRLGRFDDSITACERAIRISPRDSRVPTWQGLIGFNEFQRGNHGAAEQALRASVMANPRVPFYGVVLAATVAEQGRHDEAAKILADTHARHPKYGRGTLTAYWVATDPRFLAGRDRIATLAGELGLPP
jgi:TolB-like protein